MKAKDAIAILKAEEQHVIQQQTEDRRGRRAQIRRAGDKSRRRERERKERLAAATAAILANPEPQLRKKVWPGPK
jgi:hypothetical protein